jgi:osmotically-inducible protein OsmY
MKRTICRIACAAILVGGSMAGRTPAAQAATARPADDLQDRIEQRIHDDGVLKHVDLKVSVAGDVVTLSGTVATAADRARAADLAKVKGITRVDNRIVVDASARPTSGTLDRAADKTKNATEKAVDKTKEGVEKGVDKSKEGVAIGAEKSASGLKKAGNEVADAFILASVKTRLFGDDALKGSDINVDCDAHVVTLKGTVPTAAGRARAIELAQKTEGVSRVVDRLVIGPKK